MNSNISPNEIDIKLHHIAYATRDTDKSINALSHIYSTVECYRIYEQSQNVYFSYISNDSLDHKIELIEPASGPNPVEKYLRDQNAQLYHICYSVNNFKKGYEFFRKNGYIPVSQPFKPSFLSNVIVCHFFSNYDGILEIMGNEIL